MMIRTWKQLEELIYSFDGTPADLERIAANPVASVELLARLFEGIESETEAQALVAANPRWAAELAESTEAYESLVNGPDFAAIAAAADPAPLIAALSPKDRAAFVQQMIAMPPDATEHECATAYLQMVLTE
jgi:spermidine/putrescine-binding protein